MQGRRGAADCGTGCLSCAARSDSAGVWRHGGAGAPGSSRDGEAGGSRRAGAMWWSARGVDEPATSLSIAKLCEAMIGLLAAACFSSAPLLPCSPAPPLPAVAQPAASCSVGPHPSRARSAISRSFAASAAADTAGVTADPTAGETTPLLSILRSHRPAAARQAKPYRRQPVGCSPGSPARLSAGGL